MLCDHGQEFYFCRKCNPSNNPIDAALAILATIPPVQNPVEPEFIEHDGVRILNNPKEWKDQFPRGSAGK